MSSGNCSTIYPEAPIANMTAKTLPGGHYNIVNLLYSDSCLPKWEVDGFCVHEPVVGINSIIALLIGIYVYGKLKVLPTRGAGVRRSLFLADRRPRVLTPPRPLNRVLALPLCIHTHAARRSPPRTQLYAWTFLTYGVMMTTGLFVHCLLYDNAELEAIVGLWVSTLTTAIAVGFGFCALSDLGVIDSDKFGIRVLVILIDIAVYVAYTRVKSFDGFFYLYVVPIVLFCGGWVLVQAYICKITRSYVGVPNLILAAVSGGLGLNASTSLRRTLVRFALWN